MKKIQEHFNKIKGDALGLFDIDMVLIHSKNPAFQMANMKKHKVIFKKLLASLSPLEIDLTFNLTMKSTGIELIDKNAPNIITEISRKIPKLIAFTGSLSGSLEDIPDLVRFRNQQLNSVGINFSKSFPEHPEIIFNMLDSYRGNYPEFKQGVLSANGDNKGAVLIQFLKTISFKPSSIVFIDDRENNIKEVEAALSDYDSHIHFMGIIYDATEQFSSQEIDEETFNDAWIKMINKAKAIAN